MTPAGKLCFDRNMRHPWPLACLRTPKTRSARVWASGLGLCLWGAGVFGAGCQTPPQRTDPNTTPTANAKASEDPRAVRGLYMGLAALQPSPRGTAAPAPSPAWTSLVDAAYKVLSARPLRGHTDSVNTAIFSPDSERVVTASADQTARIW